MTRKLPVLGLIILTTASPFLQAQVEDFITGRQLNQLVLKNDSLYWKSDCTRSEMSQTQISRRPLEADYSYIFYDTLSCQLSTTILTKMAVDDTHAYWVDGDGDIRRKELNRSGLTTYIGPVNSAVGISPNGETAVSANYFFWTEELGEFRDRSAIFRRPKEPGGSLQLIRDYSLVNNALVTALAAIHDGRIIYLLSDGRLVEMTRVALGEPPLLFYFWQETDLISAEATALQVINDRLWWADRSSDGRSTLFRSAPLSDLGDVTLHHLAFRTSAHTVREFVADEANLFYHDLTASTTGPLMRKSLTDSSPEQEIASLLYTAKDMVISDRHVAWRKNFNTVSRLPINAATVTRDFAATGLEVVQVVQNSDNDNPLVMGKPTFVRTFGQILSSSAGENHLEFWPPAYLHGDKDGAPLEGSPLAPYRTSPLMTSASFRTRYDHGYWFRLPDSWTRQGTIRLRSEINPTRVLSETGYANNSRSDFFDFVRQATITMVMKPTRTRVGTIYEYSPTMQPTFDYIEALLPVSELRVVWGGGLIEEPYDPFHWIGDGGPFEVTNEDDDGSAMLTELNTRKVFTTRRYSEPPSGHGFDHYVAMLKPQSNRPWTGLGRLGNDGINYTVAPSAFFNRPERNGLGVPLGAATQCQELAHNYGRQHVNCGEPEGIDSGYPYATNTIYSPGIDYIGFNPFTQRLILPADARDFLSYCGPKWTSDYTWRALVNLIGDIPEGGGGGGGGGANSFLRSILAVDFNDRAEPSLTPSGFEPFVITSSGGSGIQTADSKQTFRDGINVTLRGRGADTGYDDRARDTPESSGTFDQSWLLRDFVFSRDLGNGGLEIVIDGLEPNHAYQVRLWSFDAVSAGVRVAEWFANFVSVGFKYEFDGREFPASNEQYLLSFPATADSSGTLVLSGQRNEASVDAQGLSSFGVFINALQIMDIVSPPAGSSFLTGVLDGSQGRAAFKQVLPVMGPTELAAIQSMMSGLEPSENYEIRASQGKDMVATYPVYVGGIPTDEGGEHDGIFMTLADLDPTVDKLEFLDLTQGHVVVGEIQGGGQAPTVSIEAPAPGAMLPRNAPFDITWTGQDADADALVYTVRFSPDGGSNWQVLASSTPGTSVSMRTSGLSGGDDCFIEVIVSDGIKTGTAISGPFSLEKGAPKAYGFIETSRGKDCGNFGRIFLQPTEYVFLWGEAFDDEDGEIGEESLVWYISGPINGVAVGNKVSGTDLPPGDYEIQLVAYDSDQYAGTNTLHLTVEPYHVEDAGGPIHVDGHPDDAGYLRSRQGGLRIYYENNESAQVRMVRDGANLYICASGLRDGGDPDQSFSVSVDVDGSGGPSPGVGDLKFEVFADGRLRTLTGNGSTYDVDELPNGLTGVVFVHGAYWSAELCLNLSRLGGYNGQTLLMGLDHHYWDGNDQIDRMWPSQADPSSPTGYGAVVLGSNPNDRIDGDFDGLPDKYEVEVVGDIKLTGDDDSDGDGQTNGQEFEAGTDPKNPNSYFQIKLVEGTSGQGQAISWEPRPDRSYNIFASSDLFDWELVDADVHNGIWPLPPGEPEVFYKVEVCYGR